MKNKTKRKIKNIRLKPKIRSGMTIDSLHRFYFQKLSEQPAMQSLMKNLANL